MKNEATILDTKGWHREEVLPWPAEQVLQGKRPIDLGSAAQVCRASSPILAGIDKGKGL